MAGVSEDRLFRLEAGGRTVGRFRTAERAGRRVALAGWAWERMARPGAMERATIVLTDATGEELRRWSCGRVEPEGDRVLAERIRVVAEPRA